MCRSDNFLGPLYRARKSKRDREGAIPIASSNPGGKRGVRCNRFTGMTMGLFLHPPTCWRGNETVSFGRSCSNLHPSIWRRNLLLIRTPGELKLECLARVCMCPGNSKTQRNALNYSGALSEKPFEERKRSKVQKI